MGGFFLRLCRRGPVHPGYPDTGATAGDVSPEEPRNPRVKSSGPGDSPGAQGLQGKNRENRAFSRIAPPRAEMRSALAEPGSSLQNRHPGDRLDGLAGGGGEPVALRQVEFDLPAVRQVQHQRDPARPRLSRSSRLLRLPSGSASLKITLRPSPATAATPSKGAIS